MGLIWTGVLLGTQKTREHFVFEKKAEPNVLSADHFDFLQVLLYFLSYTVTSKNCSVFLKKASAEYIMVLKIEKNSSKLLGGKISFMRCFVKIDIFYASGRIMVNFEFLQNFSGKNLRGFIGTGGLS